MYLTLGCVEFLLGMCCGLSVPWGIEVSSGSPVVETMGGVLHKILEFLLRVVVTSRMPEFYVL